MMKPTSVVLGLSCVSVAATAVLIVLAGKMYWSASPSRPEGGVILFHHVMPQPYGGMLWLSMKPVLVVGALASVWYLWRLGRAWREKPPVGTCRTCGYDLRATPEADGALLDRCPECGTEDADGAEGAVPGRSA